MRKETKKKWKLFLYDFIPFLIMISLSYIFNSELGIFIIGLILVAYTLVHRYEKREIFIFIFGVIIGIILELTGNIALGQTWRESSFFKIPIWLPIFWGYGFVVIRRIGNIIVR